MRLFSARKRTISIAVDGQTVLRRSGQVFESGIALSFFDHQMYNDQGLEADCPGRVA